MGHHQAFQQDLAVLHCTELYGTNSTVYCTMSYQRARESIPGAVQYLGYASGPEEVCGEGAEGEGEVGRVV